MSYNSYKLLRQLRFGITEEQLNNIHIDFGSIE
jgi:hypothetical protein